MRYSTIPDTIPADKHKEFAVFCLDKSLIETISALYSLLFNTSLEKMDILKRNTDYALRAMVHLATHWKESPSSARTLASEESISYPLVHKLMQKLIKAELVESSVGSKGGFSLSRRPSKVSLLEIIETIQGPLRLNRCLLDVDSCLRQTNCPVSKKLTKLQKYMEKYLHGITLDDLLPARKSPSKKKRNMIPEK